MDRLPFSIYDFFGYLASGFVLMASLAAAFTNSDAWQQSPGVIVGTLFVVVAYSAGHIIANIAGYLLESKLVGSILGAPSTVLFGDGPTSRWLRVFPGYYRPLPATQSKLVLERARARGCVGPGQGLFYHCFSVAKADDPTMLRLSTFLNLYGFARNMTVALVLSAAALVVGSLLGTASTGSLVPPGWWAAAAGLGAIGLVYRYLKFFRHYAVEVFVFYAEAPEER